MSFQLALKKAGLPLVRSLLHSIQGVQPALPLIMKKRNEINYKVKSYKDGKIVNVAIVSTLEEAFPAKGDTK